MIAKGLANEAAAVFFFRVNGPQIMSNVAAESVSKKDTSSITFIDSTILIQACPIVSKRMVRLEGVLFRNFSTLTDGLKFVAAHFVSLVLLVLSNITIIDPAFRKVRRFGISEEKRAP